ncbi:hypothetical protein PC129_g20464 [Phytophthora cactorum]|uniref:ribonuclease H n=1 Tax=Phytophthora cactorum TaxID=29920 RepID=A0A8T1ANV9_9STRA|nr:hypothetical protein Pcac1_g8301 [Phytophthora cactorum]KAG2797932.1 hypothetical protein PC111_g21074 [Phytophthora cactorum]KAG2799589.1 hypothetical protein PC112_g20836 [Phytophthora cactorum]KAG2832276.1 hypothetical protein PC113_g20783 [Phytophthora cactorum]KAG2877719.1 hypothetical protein PC114_g23487 [Phytophthora cactorum]
MGWFEYDSDNGYEYFEPSEYYAVAVGRNPGIYTRHEDAVEQVFGFPGFRMRRFDNYEDARDYLEEFDIFYDSETEGSDLEEESDAWFYAVSVGRYTGVYLEFDDAVNQVLGYPRARMEQFLDYEEAARFIENNQVFFYEEEEKSEEPKIKRALYLSENRLYYGEEEEEKSEESEEEKWYYAVAVGRRVGIYTDHQDAMDQVYGYSSFRMKKFLDYSNALDYLALFSEVEAESEEEESEPEPEEEGWYYAVAVGRSPGIYTNHEDVKEQVHCYSGFRMKKFLDYDEAQAYIDFNQQYSSSEEWDSDEDTTQGAETWQETKSMATLVFG